MPTSEEITVWRAAIRARVEIRQQVTADQLSDIFGPGALICAGMMLERGELALVAVGESEPVTLTKGEHFNVVSD